MLDIGCRVWWLCKKCGIGQAGHVICHGPQPRAEPINQSVQLNSTCPHSFCMVSDVENGTGNEDEVEAMASSRLERLAPSILDNNMAMNWLRMAKFIRHTPALEGVCRKLRHRRNFQSRKSSVLHLSTRRGPRGSEDVLDI